MLTWPDTIPGGWAGCTKRPEEKSRVAGRVERGFPFYASSVQRKKWVGIEVLPSLKLKHRCVASNTLPCSKPTRSPRASGLMGRNFVPAVRNHTDVHSLYLFRGSILHAPLFLCSKLGKKSEKWRSRAYEHVE